MSVLPKKLLNSPYRKALWKNAQGMLKKFERVVPVKSAYVLGSFTTKKRRPADVDFILLVQTKAKSPKAHWPVDFVIAPANKCGAQVLEDAKKWMKQKYGARKSAVIRIK